MKRHARARCPFVLVLSLLASTSISNVIHAAAGKVKEFPIPTANSGSGFITIGPDDNLWFTEANANKFGRITHQGHVVEFPVPTANSMPLGITIGPDGNLWFAESSGNRIGRITTH